MACSMYLALRPERPAPMLLPHLVASTMRSRLPLCAIQLPSTVSDSPPTWPGTQLEYMSALSTRLKPASTKASSIAKEAFSSSVQPNTLPPKASGAT